MSEQFGGNDDATALVRWLLERGVDGLGLTKTHALQRAVVREVAERWPRWWSYHARGRELLGDPKALLQVLHDDLGGEGFEGDAWLLIEEVLLEHGPLEGDGLREIVGRLLVAGGWRDADGAPIQGWALVGALHPVLCRAEGYGLLRRHREPLTFELTAAGRE